MDFRNKLEEARYFLNRLRLTAQDSDEFMYILSAFLSAWRSVFDVMLYDYAERYSLGLTREDRITDHEFEIAAKALNHTEALRFIRWWRQQRGVLKQNPLWKKRTIVIHRGYPPAIHVHRLYVAESMALSSTFTVSGAAPESYVEPVVAPSPPPSVIPTETTIPETEVETRFEDLPDRSVVDYSQEAFEKMEEIVEAAEREFPTQ